MARQQTQKQPQLPRIQGPPPAKKTTVTNSPLAGSLLGIDLEDGDYSDPNETLDDIQQEYSILGLIPGPGMIINAENAYISYKRGDNVGAVLNGIAAIPFAGLIGKAGKVASKSSKGLHVALGLTENGKLFTFAQKEGLTTYFDFYKSTVFDEKGFTELMNKADSIHFNTEGFDFLRFARWIKNDGQLRFTKWNNTVTNYELIEVLTNPAWKVKLVFH